MLTKLPETIHPKVQAIAMNITYFMVGYIYHQSI